MEVKPMKCIKEIETNEIARIYDERAESLVNSETHVFVSKKTWKETVRDFGKKK